MYEPLRFMEQIENMVLLPENPSMADWANNQVMSYFSKNLEINRADYIAENATLWTQWLNNSCLPVNVDELNLDRKKIRQMFRSRKKEFEECTGLQISSPEDFYHHALLNILHHDWILNKRVYKVDRNMSVDFLTMNMPELVATDVFSKLPSKCFYIDFDGAMHFCTGSCGVFVVYDIVGNTAIFFATTIIPHERIIPVTTVWRVGVSDDGKLSTNLNMFRESYSVQLEDGFTVTFYEREFMRYILNFCLYLNADNNDVQYTERTKSVYKKPAAGAKPTNRVREIEEFGVGYRYSTSVPHKRQKSSNKSGKDLNAPKRDYTSHYRSAHWHSYWVNDADNPGQKKVVLRWIQEVFVHGNVSSDKASVHVVKKGEK